MKRARKTERLTWIEGGAVSFCVLNGYFFKRAVKVVEEYRGLLGKTWDQGRYLSSLGSSHHNHLC